MILKILEHIKSRRHGPKRLNLASTHPNLETYLCWNWRLIMVSLEWATLFLSGGGSTIQAYKRTNDPRIIRQECY